MMAVMTADPPLALLPGEAVAVGLACGLVEDAEGGRVFVHGNLVFAWDAADEAGRRLAAVQLVATKAARAMDVAAAFGVNPTRCRGGAKSSAPRGQHRPLRWSRGTPGGTLQAVATAVGISITSVRRALEQPQEERELELELDGQPSGGEDPQPATPVPAPALEPERVVPVLPDPVPRTVERGLARAGLLVQAPPVFHPAGRVGLAGLFLALPALAATGLLDCAHRVYGQLPAGFYGLDSMLVEGVVRVWRGTRAEGATRSIRSVGGCWPEVKTIRRKIGWLAAQGKAAELLFAMAQHHLARHQVEAAGVVLYVDGHVRAYQGTRKIAKTHAARLKFPAPATVETWISDGRGDPVLVVMAEPAASLAGELRRLLPTLRAAVGDDRRVLVGFDRGGWSPALFAHMAAAGFDILTWRKQPAPDINRSLFTKVNVTDDTGLVHTWQAADTMVDLPVDDQGGTISMRQVTRLIDTKTGTRQAHVVTTRTDLSVPELLYRMGSRWQENYFRYARMHLALDAHDSYTATDDDPERMVPNPTKKTTRDTVNNARAHLDRVQAATDALLLDWHTPPAGPPWC